MSDVNDSTMGDINAGCLREILCLWVFLIEFGQKLQVTAIIIEFICASAWEAHECVGGKHLLDFIAYRLSFEASFKPDPHFFCLLINIILDV